MSGVFNQNNTALWSFITSFMFGGSAIFYVGLLLCGTTPFFHCIVISSVVSGICGWNTCSRNGYDAIYIAKYSIMSMESSVHRLGDISAKYESNDSVSTISKGINDAGGISYGKYQLSSKAGTMKTFLQSKDGMQFVVSNVTHSYGLDIDDICSDHFNKNYLKICDYQRNKMEDAQHSFIKKTHYLPLLRKVTDLGYDVQHNAMKEAIWSMGVQHGGAIKIFKTVKNNNNIKDMSLQTLIKELYGERELYALKYTHKSWHNPLKRRYKSELQDLINMIE